MKSFSGLFTASVIFLACHASFVFSQEVQSQAPEQIECKESVETSIEESEKECAIKDELGCWVYVDKVEDCESGIAAIHTDVESQPIVCFIADEYEEPFLEETQEEYEESVETSIEESKTECAIKDELGCWVYVDKVEDCESDIAAIQTDVESQPIVCFIADEYEEPFLEETQEDQNLESVQEEANTCTAE